MRSLFAVLVVFLAGWHPLFPFEKDQFELVGKVLQSDRKPFRKGASVVILHAVSTPFSTQTGTSPDGQFKFKALPAGTYTVIAAVEHAGEIRKTVEVGPSFADSKGRVVIDLIFDRMSPFEKGHIISTAELAVPEAALAEYKHAEADLSRRDVERAVKHLRKSVEIAPQYSAAWNLLGTIAYQTKKYPQAEEYFREALKHDPSAYSPLVNLGAALLAQGKVKDSLTFNLSAVKMRPDDALAHSQLGSSYYFLEQLDDAEGQLLQAKALDPSHFSLPQLTLIDIYTRRNQLAKAIAEMEEFLKLHPDSPIAPRIRTLLVITRTQLPPKP